MKSVLLWIFLLCQLMFAASCNQQQTTEAESFTLDSSLPEESETILQSESTSSSLESDRASQGSIQDLGLYRATLTKNTVLQVSPKNIAGVTPNELTIGEKVSVMGKNQTQSHLRVVWNAAVGWVSTGATELNGDVERMQALPIYEREPPACAIPVKTHWSLSSTWTTTKQSRVAVVVDLFRDRFGQSPESSLALTIDGIPINDSRRPIKENGQFTLKDVVLTLPDYMQPNDTLGYKLETTSEEPLVFVALIFEIPDNCVWDN